VSPESKNQPIATAICCTAAWYSSYVPLQISIYDRQVQMRVATSSIRSWIVRHQEYGALIAL